MKIKGFYFGLFLLLVICFTGCQPLSRVEIQESGSREEEAYPNEIKMIDNRIQHLEQALLSGEIRPNNKQVAEEFIGAYLRLKELLILEHEDQNNVFIINRILQKIRSIEDQYFASMDIYAKLLNDLGEKETLPAQPGEQQPKSQVKVHEGGNDRGDSDIQPGNSLTAIIQEANQLVQRQAFTEAKLLLIKARIKSDSASEIQIIDQALKDIEIKQNRIEQGEPPVNYLSEKEAQEHATALIEEEKYEEALNILENLEAQQQVLDEEGKRLKDLVVEKIINRDRNRAAQLYLQAKNTQDPSKKRALLHSSLDILKKLVEKYPSSHLIKKINDHISIVEESLNES